MKFHRFSFSHADFSTLPKSEQIFVLRLAHIRNDLRCLNSLFLTAGSAVKKEQGIAREVAIHQFILYYRYFYGTIREAWNVIKSAWAGDCLGQSLPSRLSPEAMAAHKTLAKYFSNPNLIAKVRNNAAFHYRLDGLQEILAEMKPEEEHEFIVGQIAGNTFYSFAEKVHSLALLRLTEETDTEMAVKTLFGDAFDVYDKLVEFSNAVLLEIVGKLGYKIEEIEISDLVDPRTIPSVLFIDPQASIV